MRALDSVLERMHRVPPILVDAAIGAGIFTLGYLAQLGTPPARTDPYFVLPHGQHPAFLTLLALAALGTALRRTSLFAACLLVLVATLGGLWAWNDWYGILLPEVVLLYTVSERRGLRGSLIALAASLVLFSVAQHQRTVQAGYTDLSNLPSFIEGIYPYLVLVWFAGRAQGRRRVLAAQLDRGVAELREEREQMARASVVAERSRIARDLHTLVVRGVEQMSAEGRAARVVLREGTPRQASENIAGIESTGRATLVEMRRLMAVLRAGDGVAGAPLAQFDETALPAGPAAGGGSDSHATLPLAAGRMEGQPFADSLRRWIDVPWVASTAPVLALALMAISEPLVGLPWPTTAWPPFLPLVLIAVLALLLRRRFPLVVLAILTIEVFITNAFLGQGSPPYTVDRSMLVAVYTVAATGGLLWGIVGLGAEVIAYAPLLFVRPQIWWPYDLAGWSAVFLFAVIGGLAVRSSRRLSTELQEQTELLRRTREERIRLVVVEERTRVARDLHDLVGHGVTVMVIQAGAARALAKRHQDRAREALALVERTGQDVIRELDSLLRDMGAGVQDLSASLWEPGDRSVTSLVGHAIDEGLRVHLHIEGQPAGQDPGLEVALFRIVQEALTNVRKHAPGASAWVAIRYSSDGVEVEVKDTGGTRQTLVFVLPGAGQGLVGIAERAALFGGEADAGPIPDGGFRVRARLRTASLPV